MLSVLIVNFSYVVQVFSTLLGMRKIIHKFNGIEVMNREIYVIASLYFSISSFPVIPT